MADIAGTITKVRVEDDGQQKEYLVGAGGGDNIAIKVLEVGFWDTETGAFSYTLEKITSSSSIPLQDEDVCFVDVVGSNVYVENNNILKSWSYIYFVEHNGATLKFWAKNKPTENLNIIIKW